MVVCLLIKRIVIAGCRDYNNYDEAKKYIDFCIQNLRKDNELIFLSGGCKGADALGERYAKENNFKIDYYPAEWEKYGKSAGPKRNLEMAKNCDYVICFWDGKSKGTKTMIEFANQLNRPIKVKRITT